jgi:hypothetical protein
MRRGLVLSDELRLGLFGGGTSVRLPFPHNFFYLPPILFLISYPGSHRHATSGYIVYQANMLMHGLGDLILVTNF